MVARFANVLSDEGIVAVVDNINVAVIYLL